MNRSAILIIGLFVLPAHAESTDTRLAETRLVNSLNAISSNNLDTALSEVDAILKQNPNFKLAQMLKGDLLMARARPLNGMGSDPEAPRERIEELREEARARLQRVQEQIVTAPPRFIWQLNPEQKYAIVVDTSKSTLYLYENHNGTPRYVENFYISVGKKGADKLVEGDQKTPLGVYFVNAHLSKKQLTDFYGSGAYPINYPNEWDSRQGRNGHGIWLHGTPSDTFSRPPLASNGCVVLNNDDLTHLGKSVQVGTTPVIITSRMETFDESDRIRVDEMKATLEQWRKDWSSLDTEAYLKHYAKDFSTGGHSLESWSAQKRTVNAGKSWIKVALSDVSMFAYPTQPDLVVVNFEQDYSSNNLNNRMKKRQYWIKRNDRWQIAYEGAAS